MSRVRSSLALAATAASALAVALGCRPVDSGLEAGFQSDADVVRLQHLEHYAGLVEEYRRKRGHYPLEGRSALPIYVYVANEHQTKAAFETPQGPHEVVSFAEFVAVLEAGLGRPIEERFDPQHAATYKPIVYLYSLRRGDFAFSVHLYGEAPFARQISRRDFEVQVSSAPDRDRRIWSPDSLFRSAEFRAAVASSLAKPAFFRAREREYADWSKRVRRPR